MGKIVSLFSWEVFCFPWGTAVREKRTKEWQRVYVGPEGKELVLEGIPVILHENGIEFL